MMVCDGFMPGALGQLLELAQKLDHSGPSSLHDPFWKQSVFLLLRTQLELVVLPFRHSD